MSAENRGSDPLDSRSESMLTPIARRRVLGVLTQSVEPMDAVMVADALGLHVTTARFHLERLGTDGLVSRAPAAEQRRGRPRIVYRPAGIPRDEQAREQLITVLADALAKNDSDQQQALRAGEQWADSFPPTSDDSVRDLNGVLSQLGFAPEQHADSISLHACPFRDAARANPEVVCAVHRGLVRRVAARSDEGRDAQLIPFVEAELCLVMLTPSVSPAER